MFNSLIPSVMTLSSFLICLVSAVVLGLLTALVFGVQNKQSSALSLSLVLLPPVVTLIIMLVNGNIGAGLAVAGAFSLVRFRSAPGTARDISGLFTATALGLACGMGYVGIAAVFFLVIAAVVLALTLLRFGERSSRYRHLKITVPENLDYETLFDEVFERYTTRHELSKVKTTNMGTLYELSYDIYLKDGEVSKQFIDELRCRNGNLNVVCSRQAETELL